MRIFAFIFLVLTGFGLQAQDQNDLMQGKHKTKRMWRRHGGKRERNNKTAFNPYLKKKAKDKPSAKIAQGNKRDDRRQLRRAKRQKRRAKKKTGY